MTPANRRPAVPPPSPQARPKDRDPRAGPAEQVGSGIKARQVRLASGEADVIGNASVARQPNDAGHLVAVGMADPDRFGPECRRHACRRWHAGTGRRPCAGRYSRRQDQRRIRRNAEFGAGRPARAADRAWPGADTSPAGAAPAGRSAAPAPRVEMLAHDAGRKTSGAPGGWVADLAAEIHLAVDRAHLVDQRHRAVAVSEAAA